MVLQIVGCSDYTCSYNYDGICKKLEISHTVTKDSAGRNIVICESYEEKKDE
ncbi:MAG: hypothetical protein PHP50_14260 [Lachnospiraceae bacterium]|nr:hypothetical protein [Lachnospiraceae bacterium]